MKSTGTSSAFAVQRGIESKQLSIKQNKADQVLFLMEKIKKGQNLQAPKYTNALFKVQNIYKL